MTAPGDSIGGHSSTEGSGEEKNKELEKARALLHRSRTTLLSSDADRRVLARRLLKALKTEHSIPAAEKIVPNEVVTTVLMGSYGHEVRAETLKENLDGAISAADIYYTLFRETEEEVNKLREDVTALEAQRNISSAKLQEITEINQGAEILNKGISDRLNHTLLALEFVVNNLPEGMYTAARIREMMKNIIDPDSKVNKSLFAPIRKRRKTRASRKDKKTASKNGRRKKTTKKR
jgi:hypothetical protein